MMAHVEPWQRINHLNFEYLKIKDGGGCYLEKSQKSRYLHNGLTDLYEICYADAKWVS